MDPEATLKIAAWAWEAKNSEYGDRLADLADWLRKGGFKPVPKTQTERDILEDAEAIVYGELDIDRMNLENEE